MPVSNNTAPYLDYYTIRIKKLMTSKIDGAWVRIIYDSQLDRKKQSNDKTNETQYKEMETQQK